ncbi:MAG: cyclic nucleotide-binding domain-containing protein [Bacteriovoracaceae bacterium]
MSSFESKGSKNIDAEKMRIPMLKYLWQAGPLSRSKYSIPKFFRQLEILRHFSDWELKILSSFMHKRSFKQNEVIFDKDDIGIGFYFIYSGKVEVIEDSLNQSGNMVSILDRFSFFGEEALLQENCLRSGKATTLLPSELIGIFKPDLFELIKDYPVIATKMLQAVSVILANKIQHLSFEVRELKEKLAQYESP